MVVVREVKTRKEKRDFINFPLKLYKNNPYFVPPLYCDEKALFKEDNVNYEQSEAVYFNAYLDGKIVGRISGILQKASNEKWNQTRIRFTRFDSIDNQDVANALFKQIEIWAKEKGMTEIVGPLGFSDLEREGLLIEGFNELSTFEEQYNYDYYQKLIENCGFKKEVDWVESKIKLPEVIDPRLKRISEMMLKKFKLKLVNEEVKTLKEFIRRYEDQFFDILDKTYVNLYGTVPFTDRMKKQLIKSFKLILDIEKVAAIVDENDRIVCFGLIFPSIGKALQKSGGRLTLPTLIKVYKAIKHPKVIDFGLIGVLPEYQMKGVSTALLQGIIEIMQKYNVDYAETNLNLETNASIQNQWKNFDAVQHKRRRCFIKEIN